MTAGRRPVVCWNSVFHLSRSALGNLPSSHSTTATIHPFISKRQFGYLTDTIASLDYEVNNKLSAQQNLVNQLSSSVAKATTELNAAREKTKKEHNDVKGMESGWSFKAFKAVRWFD